MWFSLCPHRYPPFCSYWIFINIWYHLVLTPPCHGPGGATPACTADCWNPDVNGPLICNVSILSECPVRLILVELALITHQLQPSRVYQRIPGTRWWCRLLFAVDVLSSIVYALNEHLTCVWGRGVVHLTRMWRLLSCVIMYIPCGLFPSLPLIICKISLAMLYNHKAPFLYYV